MTKLSIDDYQNGIDNQIELIKRQKQWYLDYRMGSGMTPMLEEFAKVLDDCVTKFEIMKQVSNQIDPHSLVGKRP